MESVLYEAAVEGSVPSLLRLLQEDKLVLHRFVSGCFTETPLHLAAMLGHLEFAKHILARLPQMAGERDTIRNSSPLHLASANGHLELVKELLLANSEMCLAKDCQGRNPLHIAVIKGHTEVLKELVRANPLAARTYAGTGTILHLCVKHHQLEALEYLVGMMAGDGDCEFINSKDQYGSTILHLAAESRQYEMLEFLRSNTAIDGDSQNSSSFLEFDIERQAKIPIPEPRKKSMMETEQSWLEKKKQALMVVAGLIATVTFQAGINPPGGLWQDTLVIRKTTIADGPWQGPSPDSDTAQGPGINQLNSLPHKAGFSIMAYNEPVLYFDFLVCNSTSLIASLSIILLLVSGLPLKRRLFMWILMVIVWVAITTMTMTYIFAVDAFTPDEQWETDGKVVQSVINLWMALMALLVLGQTVRLIVRMVRKIKKFPSGPIHQYIFGTLH